MFSKKENITVFISDYRCAYMTERSDVNQSFYDSIDLPEGIIVNGYIKEPHIFYSLLLENMKLHKFKFRSVNILIHDQNLLIRNLSIKKDELQRKSIEQYLHEQTDKKVYFPFEKAAISHFVQKDDEQSVNTLALITDEDLLNDYYDIFDKLGAKEVTFDIPSSSLYELYKDDTKTDSNHVMMVTLYQKLLAIQIFANHIPIFQMIEELDGSKSNYTHLLENYIERIANYYKYNINKGASSVEDIIIYNLSDQIKKTDINEDVIPHLTDFKASLFDFEDIFPNHQDMPKSCLLPFASIKTSQAQFQLPFEFKLERIKRVNIYGNYLMVVAFLIFTSVTLLYIPFFLFREDVSNQQNINQNLENQLNILQSDQKDDPIYTDEQIIYNDIYENLNDKEVSYQSYIEDLTTKLTAEITLNSIEINATDNAITLVISGNLKTDIDEYILSIYEAYGISDLVVNDGRWIVSPPEINSLSELVMEVTVYYA